MRSCFLLQAAVAALLLSGAAQAQKNLRPGYIVTGSDTLRGRVDDRRWVNPPETISITDAAGVRSFPLGQVTAVHIEGGDHYLVRTLRLDKTPLDMNNMVEEGGEIFVERRVLLRELYAGPRATLYEVADAARLHYVIADAGGQVSELIYRVVYAAGSRSQSRTVNGYRTQLLALAPDADMAARDRISRVNFNAADLISVMPLVNGTPDAGQVKAAKSKMRRITVHPIIAFGVGRNTLRFRSTPTMGIPPETGTSNALAIYTAFDLEESRTLKRLVLRLSVTADRYKYSGTAKTPTSTITYATEVSKWRPAASVNYTYSVGAVHLFGGAGVGFSIARYKNHQFGYAFPSAWFTPHLQAGFHAKHFFLNYEYQFSTRGQTSAERQMDLTTTALVFGIRL